MRKWRYANVKPEGCRDDMNEGGESAKQSSVRIYRAVGASNHRLYRCQASVTTMHSRCYVLHETTVPIFERLIRMIICEGSRRRG